MELLQPVLLGLLWKQLASWTLVLSALVPEIQITWYAQHLMDYTILGVTIGLPEQNAVFIRALKEVLNDGS